MAFRSRQRDFSLIREISASLLPAATLLIGCSSAPPDYREVDVQLPSGEIKESVRVLADEDVESTSISLICRTYQSVKHTRSFIPPRPREYCGSYAYWNQWAPTTQWIHPEKGEATLAADYATCRRSKGRFDRCMEKLGYSLFSVD